MTVTHFNGFPSYLMLNSRRLRSKAVALLVALLLACSSLYLVPVPVQVTSGIAYSGGEDWVANLKEC